MGVRSGCFQGIQYGRGIVRLRWLEEEGSSGWLMDLPRSAPAFSMLLLVMLFLSDIGLFSPGKYHRLMKLCVCVEFSMSYQSNLAN